MLWGHVSSDGPIGSMRPGAIGPRAGPMGLCRPCIYTALEQNHCQGYGPALGPTKVRLHRGSRPAT